MNSPCTIVGILVNGGQAPGIKSVISAVTIPFKQRGDITLQPYQIACQCMIRLSDEDFKSQVALARCVAVSGCRRKHFNAGFSLSVRT